jgi:hypothetical protein
MGDCACVWVPDYDPAEIYWRKIRTARKPKNCEECRREIAPGERYEHVQMRYEDDWSSFATCLDCVSIRESFFCDGWLHGSMLDDLAEHLYNVNGEVASKCISPLTPGARDLVCDMVEDVWARVYDDEEDEDL